MKRLGLSTTPHPQPYSIGWLHEGWDLKVFQQCCLPYNIKPFTDKVLCDVTPLDVCDVLLGQPYLWRWYVVYDSRPRAVIISFHNSLHRIPEVAPPIVTSLISTKKGSMVISHTRKFIFSLIRSQSKGNIITTSMTPWRVTPRSSNNKGIQSWQNIGTTSPHPQGYNTSFGWAAKSGCICRNNTLQEPIRSSDHADMVLTPLLRLWDIMLWSTTFLHSFTCTMCSMCTALDQASHHYWTRSRLQNNSPKTKFSRWRNSMQWGPFLPKGRRMMQVDVGGHPPIPLGPPQLSLSEIVQSRVTE